MEHRRQRREGAPVPLQRAADARCQRAGGWRRRPRPAEQPERRGLLPTVPVCVKRHPRTAARHQRRARDLRDRQDGDGRHRQPGRRQPRRVDQDRLGLARLQHGPALHRSQLWRCRLQTCGAVADQGRRGAARLLHAIRARCRRRAVGGQDRAHRCGRQPEPDHRAGVGQPGCAEHRHWRGRSAARDRERPERRCARLWCQRLAAGPGARPRHRLDQRKPHHPRQLQREPRGERRSQCRQRQLRLDRDRPAGARARSARGASTPAGQR